MVPTHKWLLALAAAVSACGGGDGGPADGAARDGGEDASGLPVAASPTPPSFLPCPPGWREVQIDEDPPSCDPYPEAGPRDCASHEAHFPGGTGCETVGAACPVGDFAEGLSGDVVYVLATAAAAGDGSLGRPYQALSEIPPSSLASGATIALGKGSYDAAVHLPEGVALQGACAAQTILFSSEPSRDAGVVNAGGADVRVLDLTIGTSERPGLWVDPGSDLTAEGVIVSGRNLTAIVVNAAGSFTARGLLVRDVESWGLEIEPGGSADISRAAFERTNNVAIYVPSGATLRLEETLVRETVPRAGDAPTALALLVTDGGAAHVERSCFEDGQPHGIVAQGTGTDLELGDVVVRGTRRGVAIAVTAGGSARLERVVAEGNAWGMFAVGATVTASDVIVRDSIDNGVLIDDCSVELRNLLVARTRVFGVALFGPRAGAILEDLIVRDIESTSDRGVFGRGVNLQAGGPVTLRRALIERTREIGLFVTEADLGGEDVTISDVRDSACTDDTCVAGGFGVLVAGVDSSATLTRFLVRNAELCGVYVANDGSLDLSHGVVSDSAIGACVQSDGYDLSRLSNDVHYARNDINLDARNLPVPEPLPPVVLPP